MKAYLLRYFRCKNKTDIYQVDVMCLVLIQMLAKQQVRKKLRVIRYLLNGQLDGISVCLQSSSVILSDVSK